MLLLNIARASQNIPIYFTTVPNIAATFDFRSTAGVGAQLFSDPTEGDQTNFYTLNLAASVAENPTIFITPVQGEEFIKRLLTPMDESKFEFLVHQGVGPAVVVRMMARAIVWLVIDKTIQARVSPHVEELGQDVAELGIEAYPEFLVIPDTDDVAELKQNK